MGSGTRSSSEVYVPFSPKEAAAEVGSSSSGSSRSRGDGKMYRMEAEAGCCTADCWQPRTAAVG